MGANSRVSMSARESLIRFSEESERHLAELRAEAQAIATTLVEDYDLGGIGSVRTMLIWNTSSRSPPTPVDAINSVAFATHKALEAHRETSPDTNDATSKSTCGITPRTDTTNSPRFSKTS